MAYVNTYLQLYTAVLMAVILRGNLRTGLSGDRSYRLFHWMLFFDILMLTAGGAENYVLSKQFEAGAPLHALFSGVSDFSYFAVLGLFIIYIDVYAGEDDARIDAAAILGAAVSFIYGIFWFVSDFIGMIYTQDADRIVRGPMYYIGQVGGYITGLLSIWILIRRWKSYTRSERAGFTLFIFIPLLGSFMKDIFAGVTIMPLLITLSLVIIQSYVQGARELLLRKQQAELAGMQTDLLMSRMKPHFIYNVLNTIYVLCDVSAEQAKDAISRFSIYLRKSLVDLDSQRLIPFEDELEHVENYLAIEKLRFGDQLEIVYDIGSKDFMIPPLALQTLVENSVRHGIEKKRGGGKVTISVKIDESGHVIIVEDTGTGFDAGVPGDDRKHVGLYSASHRLENLCGASLTVDGVPGKGTVATIRMNDGKPGDGTGRDGR